MNKKFRELRTAVTDSTHNLWLAIRNCKHEITDDRGVAVCADCGEEFGEYDDFVRYRETGKGVS